MIGIIEHPTIRNSTMTKIEKLHINEIWSKIVVRAFVERYLKEHPLSKSYLRFITDCDRYRPSRVKYKNRKIKKRRDK